MEPLAQALTVAQVEQYRRLDSEIVNRLPGLQKSVQEIAALAKEIRDQRLYRAEFTTWADYCKARLGKTAGAFRQLEYRERQANLTDRAEDQLESIEKDMMSAKHDTESGVPVLMIDPQVSVELNPDLAVLAIRLNKDLQKLLKVPGFAQSSELRSAASVAARIVQLIQPELPGVAEAAPKPAKSRASLEEVSAFLAEETGLKLTPEDAAWFFNKCEGCGWKNNGKPIVDWKATVRAWQLARIFPSQKFAPKAPGETRISPAEMMVRQKELEAAELKLQQIRRWNEPRAQWPKEDLEKYRLIKARRDELKKILGIRL